MANPSKNKPRKSRYTKERGTPGAFEGETVTRRRFMTGTTHLAGAVALSAIALPALGFALGPIFEEKEVEWQPVGDLDAFSTDEYIPRTIVETEGIGVVGQTTVYMRQRNDRIDTEKPDEYNKIVAISTRCMHLGCPVRYVPASERFICPCHGGVYDNLGKVNGGPPVRPLDRFYTRVRAGRVQIGPRFSVNSQLNRFSPRDPAEPLDGIGQYAYPARFTTAKP